jgi:hypothetical protein
MLSKSNSGTTPIYPFICEQDFDASCLWLAIPLSIKSVSTSFSKACDQGNKVLAEFVELVEGYDQDQMNSWILAGDQTFKKFRHKTEFTLEGDAYIIHMHQYAIIKFGQPRTFNSKQMHLAKVLDAMFSKAQKYQNNKGSKVRVGQ